MPRENYDCQKASAILCCFRDASRSFSRSGEGAHHSRIRARAFYVCEPACAGHGKGFSQRQIRFQTQPEMRTFGAVIVHVASGIVYPATAGRGEKVNWDELDPKDYKTKAQVVALMEKSISDAEATLKGLSD